MTAAGSAGDLAAVVEQLLHRPTSHQRDRSAMVLAFGTRREINSFL
jgi:hypothetical protein